MLITALSWFSIILYEFFSLPILDIKITSSSVRPANTVYSVFNLKIINCLCCTASAASFQRLSDFNVE